MRSWPASRFLIGHANRSSQPTGCTVFLCPTGTVGSVDVRGPAPGSRETALLDPLRPNLTINAVLLTGGSAFGLAAADGVMRFLAERDIGHPTPVRPIPIVAAAVIYDLFLTQGEGMPDAELGYRACLAASAGEPRQGNFGAGTGATVGKWGGFEAMMKGGFGFAALQVDQLVVEAGAVANSVGDILNPDGSVLAGAYMPDGGWLVERDPLRRFPELPPAEAIANTTLVVLMTNARLDKVGCNRLASRAHDGMAAAVKPIHTTHDGDTAFALASGDVEASFDLVASAAAEVVAEAIRSAVRTAESLAGVMGLGRAR
ncbi:MAG: P1 family peptidase [Candidatus Promineifilaceae bacterium]